MDIVGKPLQNFSKRVKEIIKKIKLWIRMNLIE